MICKDREVESENSSTWNEKIKWRSCEECNNWCCVGCIEGRFDANDDFFCNICVC